jgi:DNA-binding CsgD family transcriptional regulator
MTTNLTLRERQVVNLVVRGNNTKHIAHVLRISAGSASRHRSRAMQKLDANSIHELIVTAVRQGLATFATPTSNSSSPGSKSEPGEQLYGTLSSMLADIKYLQKMLVEAVSKSRMLRKDTIEQNEALTVTANSLLLTWDLLRHALAEYVGNISPE